MILNVLVQALAKKMTAEQVFKSQNNHKEISKMFLVV